LIHRTTLCCLIHQFFFCYESVQHGQLTSFLSQIVTPVRVYFLTQPWGPTFTSCSVLQSSLLIFLNILHPGCLLSHTTFVDVRSVKPLPPPVFSFVSDMDHDHMKRVRTLLRSLGTVNLGYNLLCYRTS